MRRSCGPQLLREFPFGTPRSVCQRLPMKYLLSTAVDFSPFFCLAKALFRRKGLYVKAEGLCMFEVLF